MDAPCHRSRRHEGPPHPLRDIQAARSRGKSCHNRDGGSPGAEIVVNVLLPAVFALATGDGRDGVGLKNRALALYIAHPKLAENSVTREAKVALGVDYQVPEITSARDQQGLITLYREMLRTGIRPRQGRLPGV